MPAPRARTRFLRRTSSSWTRSSSSNTSRVRAVSLAAIVSGTWMSWKAVVRSTNDQRSRTSVGERVGEVLRPARAPRSIHRATSPESMPAFSDCGYTGTMRPVWVPMRSTTGLAICRSRRGRRRASRRRRPPCPGRSCRSRHRWLKKVRVSRPVPSVTTASTSPCGSSSAARCSGARRRRWSPPRRAQLVDRWPAACGRGSGAGSR